MPICRHGHEIEWQYNLQGRRFCVECKRISFRKHSSNLRDEAIKAYGGKCNCCGETEPMFLQFDHINNDGADHRRKLGGGSIKIVAWAKKNNWPNTIQLLCANCNTAKSYKNGGCPHVQS